MEPSEPIRRNSRKAYFIIFSAMLLTCLLCSTGVFVANLNQTAGMVDNIPIEVCMGFTNTPRKQVGISWTHPAASSESPLTHHSPYATCFDIPPGSIIFIKRLKRAYMFPP
jgi:hypothetical protein